jgi:hypothetical protein
VFRHQTLNPNSQAFRDSSGPISPCSKSDTKMPIRAPGQQPGKVDLAHGERQFPEIIAIGDQNIEGVKLYLIVTLA